jgi:hypothetical protein
MPNKWPSRLRSLRENTGGAGKIGAQVLGVIGGLGVLGGWIFGDTVDTVGPARSAVNTAAVASSFAQDCVRAWLLATASAHGDLDRCTTVPQDVQFPTTPAVVISAPTVVAVAWGGAAGENDAAAMFSVTVGVAERPYASAPATQAFYKVPVVWTVNGPWMATMPARVAGPGAGSKLPTGYLARLGPADPTFTLVSGFASAYLTDKGGLDRFVTSSSGLLPLGSIYREATLVGLTATAQPKSQAQEGDQVRVLAEVRVTTSQFAPTLLTYPLTLAFVGGKWSVARIDSVPVMATDVAPTPIGLTATK